MLKIGGQSSAKKCTTIIGILFTALFGLNFLSSCNYKSEKADVVFHNLQLIDCDGVGKEEAVKSAIAVVDGRIVAIGANSRSYFAKIFCYSFGAAIFVFITINMSMVLGLLPIVGSPLPIMSYGGSSMLATMIGFGIVMSARVHNQQLIA